MIARSVVASIRLALASLVLVACAARPVALRDDGVVASGAEKQSARPECRVPSDCVVTSRTCCGQCGAATVSDSVAIPRSRSRGYACTGGTACPECYAETEPGLFATCDAGLCSVRSVEHGPLSACATDADCSLTYVSCCECGATDWVAIRTDQEAAYRTLLCGRSSVSCPQCVGPRPGAATARCTNSHCQLVR